MQITRVDNSIYRNKRDKVYNNTHHPDKINFMARAKFTKKNITSEPKNALKSTLKTMLDKYSNGSDVYSMIRVSDYSDLSRCLLESLIYLMEKPVLADAVMKDDWQAMAIFKNVRDTLCKLHFDMPNRYKEEFTKVVDYLSSDEGSKILKNDTFCEGLHIAFDGLGEYSRFRFCTAGENRIETIKRAQKEPKFLKQHFTPEWQHSTESHGWIPSSKEKEKIIQYLADHNYRPEVIKNITISNFYNLDGGRKCAVMGNKYLFTLSSWKYDHYFKQLPNGREVVATRTIEC